MYLKILWDEMTSYSKFLEINHSSKSKAGFYVKTKNHNQEEIMDEIKLLAKNKLKL